jgi:hypothetical protein
LSEKDLTDNIGLSSSSQISKRKSTTSQQEIKAKRTSFADVEYETQLKQNILQSPEPEENYAGPISTFGFQPPDPQIAVSRTHVIVTTNDNLTFFERTVTAGNPKLVFRVQYFPWNFVVAPGFDGPPLYLLGTITTFA